MGFQTCLSGWGHICAVLHMCTELIALLRNAIHIKTTTTLRDPLTPAAILIHEI